MNLHSELANLNCGNSVDGIFWTLILTAPIPLFIWLVISLILWFRKKRKSLMWWSVAFGLCCACGLFAYGYSKVTEPNQAAYMIAQRINVYVPTSVTVLENEQQTAIDAHTEYEVIRFDQSQMKTFIKLIQAKGWKYGTVVPDTLRHPDPTAYPDAMSGRKFPLPKGKRAGYYYSYIKKRIGTGDWYTTRMAYFLDVSTRTLYIYFDDSQWG